MATNKAVAKAFAFHMPCNALNFRTDGETVWSYGTVIAYWHKDGHLHFNARKYSKSTSMHQSYIRRVLPENVWDRRCEYQGEDARMWRSWRDGLTGRARP